LPLTFCNQTGKLCFVSNLLTLQKSKSLSLIYFNCSQISNVNCLVDNPCGYDIYLPLYYLVNDFVHLSNPTISIPYLLYNIIFPSRHLSFTLLSLHLPLNYCMFMDSQGKWYGNE